MAQHVRKGMQLAIGGHLKQSKWLDRATGAQREAVRVWTAWSAELSVEGGVIVL